MLLADIMEQIAPRTPADTRVMSIMDGCRRISTASKPQRGSHETVAKMSICELDALPSMLCLTLFQYGELSCRLPEPQSCDELTDNLLWIEFLDVISVYAHFAVALTDPKWHRALLSCRGPMAQSLLNNTQRVSISTVKYIP